MYVVGQYLNTILFWLVKSSLGFLHFVQDKWEHHGTQIGINPHNSHFITKNGKNGFKYT